MKTIEKIGQLIKPFVRKIKPYCDTQEKMKRVLQINILIAGLVIVVLAYLIYLDFSGNTKNAPEPEVKTIDRTI